MRLIVVGMLLSATFACKQNNQTVSETKSIEDGGCTEYETKINLLQAQKQSFFQNMDADPKAASGMALYDEYDDGSYDSQVSGMGNDANTPTSNAPSGSTSQQPVVVGNADSDDQQGDGSDVSDQGANAGSQPVNGISPSIQARLAELDRQIASAQVELQKCMEQKFGQSSKKKPATESGVSGHCDYNGKPYDILNYNCHSAANQSVKEDPNNTGIISCGGDAPVQGSPAHHTFNYRREGNMIVYYNWGSTCRAPLKTFPPDIDDPDHQICARQFCGDQYQEQTKPLAAGALVEEPGPLYCSANTKTKAECDSCCQYRGKYWDLIQDPLRPTDRTFVQFMSQCYNSCYSTFKK